MATIAESELGTPVQETLSSGGSVTVPAGEVWDVTISGASDGASTADTSHQDFLLINSVGVAGRYAHGQGHSSGFPIRTIVTGGDTIELLNQSGGSYAVTISGFDISGVVDNTPVSEQVDGGAQTSGNLTVPSGETWVVSVCSGPGRNSDDLFNPGSDYHAVAEVNNHPVCGIWGDDGYFENHADRVVLTGGDVVSTSGTNINFGQAGAHIGGFKV